MCTRNESMYLRTHIHLRLQEKIPLSTSWFCMCANLYLEWTLYTHTWYKTTLAHTQELLQYLQWKERWFCFNDIESSSLFLFPHLTVFPKSCLPKSIFFFFSYSFMFSHNTHMPLSTFSISQPSILSPLNYKLKQQNVWGSIKQFSPFKRDITKISKS